MHVESKDTLPARSLLPTTSTVIAWSRALSAGRGQVHLLLVSVWGSEPDTASAVSGGTQRFPGCTCRCSWRDRKHQRGRDFQDGTGCLHVPNSTRIRLRFVFAQRPANASTAAATRGLAHAGVCFKSRAVTGWTNWRSTTFSTSAGRGGEPCRGSALELLSNT